MTDAERADADAAMRAAQRHAADGLRHLTDGLHQLVTVVTAFKLAMDLAVEGFDRQMEELYVRFPELKP